MSEIKTKKKLKLKKGIIDFIIIPFLYVVILSVGIYLLNRYSPVQLSAYANVMTAQHAPTFRYNLYKESYIYSYEVQFPSHGEKYATLRIENAELEENLCYGDDEITIKKNLGTFEGAGLPGQGKPILVAGHNGTIFKQLKYAEIGDIVELETTWGTYHYQIYEINIEKAVEWDTNRLLENKEILIMYTCYPFDQLNVPNRYFVYADLIDGPTIVEDN